MADIETKADDSTVPVGKSIKQQKHVHDVSVLSSIMNCMNTKNHMLCDASFRMATRILTFVRSQAIRNEVKKDRVEEYLKLVPVLTLEKMLTERIRAEKPFKTEYSPIVKSLTSLLVAAKRLQSAFQVSTNEEVVKNNSEDDGADEALTLFVTDITTDSITLRWKPVNATSSPAAVATSTGASGRDDNLSTFTRRRRASHSNNDAAEEDRRSSMALQDGTDRPSRDGDRENENDDDTGLDQSMDLDDGTASVDRHSSCSSLKNAREGEFISVLEMKRRQDEDFKTVKVFEDDRIGEWTCQNLKPDTAYKFRLSVQTAGSLTNVHTVRHSPILHVGTRIKSLLMFSSSAVGANLDLSNGNLSVMNKVNKKWNAVRANSGFSQKGLHTWTIRVDRIISKNIFVGICTKQATMGNYVGSDSFGYGYLSNRAIWHKKQKMKSYGELFREGDMIQVSLDLDRGTLAFERNGHDLGIAVDGIDTTLEYFPAVSLYNKDDQVTLLSHEGASNYGANNNDCHDGSAFAAERVEEIAELCDIVESLQSRTENVVKPLPTRTIKNVLLRLKLWKQQGTCIVHQNQLLRKDLLHKSIFSGYERVISQEGEGKVVGISTKNNQLYYQIPEVETIEYIQQLIDEDLFLSGNEAVQFHFGASSRIRYLAPFESTKNSLVRSSLRMERLDSQVLHEAIVQEDGKASTERHMHSFGGSSSSLEQHKDGYGVNKPTAGGLRRIQTAMVGAGGKPRRENSLDQLDGVVPVELDQDDEIMDGESKLDESDSVAYDAEKLLSDFDSFTIQQDLELVRYLNDLCLVKGISFDKLHFNQIETPSSSKYFAIAGTPLHKIKERVTLIIYINNLIRSNIQLLEVNPKSQNGQRSAVGNPGDAVFASGLPLIETKVYRLFAPNNQHASNKHVKRIAYDRKTKRCLLQVASVNLDLPLEVENEHELIQGRDAITFLVNVGFNEAIERKFLVRKTRILHPETKKHEQTWFAIGKLIGLALIHGIKLREHFRFDKSLLQGNNEQVLEGIQSVGVMLLKPEEIIKILC